MKRLFILTTFLLGISPICLNAQELTLEECQQQARAHYPLIKRYGLIVNGYAKEVLNKLPMEFAVEAQKLLSISLEGSVG